ASLRKRTIRKTRNTRRSAGKTSANQKGSTPRRSMMPSGLDTNFHRALRSLACRCGACSAATQTRNAYSMVKSTSDNSSIARNSGPYCACNAETESSVIATRLTTIRITMSRPTTTAVRSPIVPCSRISYSRRLRFAPVRQVRRGMAEFCPCYWTFSPDYAAGSTDTTLKVWDRDVLGAGEFGSHALEHVRERHRKLVALHQWQTRTGILVCVSTFVVTLPSTIAAIPLLPCEAMTMRSHPLRS